MPDKSLTEKIHRVKFKEWIGLEELREKFIKAAEGNADDFPKLFFAYLSAALVVVEEKEVRGLNWLDCIELFRSIHLVNFPSPILPIVISSSQVKKPKDAEWDYDGRTWHLYSHIIAKAYGWSLEYIANLETEEALAKVQEILTDEQLEREFFWGMSETAYSYNKSTKTSRFNPLTRPYWMTKTYKQVKTIKMRRDMLPIGNVIRLGHKDENSQTQNSQS